MRCLGVLSIVALASGVAGCANHPDVGDVTGFTTGDLIEKIQCEAQAAILENDRAEGFTGLHEELARLIAKQQARSARAEALKGPSDDFQGKLDALTGEFQVANREANAAKRKLEAQKHEITGLQSLNSSELKTLEDP